MKTTILQKKQVHKMAILHKSKFFPIFLNSIFIFLLICVFLQTNFPGYSSSSSSSNNTKIKIFHEDISCSTGIRSLKLRHEKCSYVKSHEKCSPEGYISYLELFYCKFSPPSLGYSLLAIWLVVLFYLLGDTSSKYFCASLEGLSGALKLSPTISAVTLLSLGNGAPDVFSSVISFLGNHEDTKDIGLNSILGGVFFVTSVVIGVVSICIGPLERRICPSNFIGNALFLLFSLSFLLVLIILGKVSLWSALCFFSLYLVYVALILASEVLDYYKPTSKEIHDFAQEKDSVEENLIPTNEEQSLIFWWLELPLDLPRKLTIPIVAQERWSRPFGVISATLASILLGVIWNVHYQKSWILVLPIVAFLGIVLSLILFCTSDENSPPKKYSCIWLGISFIMSITWTYLLAQELVSLMVALGVILGISHSIMGLTILAWGNSMGDLVSNLTMAKYGGPHGSQTAISGCYAGPIFNLIVGLGFSFVCSGWSAWPNSYDIVKDVFIYETFGFMMVALVWALVVLANRNMKPDKFLGVGLIAIYSCFICLKVARSFGFLDPEVSLLLHKQL